MAHCTGRSWTVQSGETRQQASGASRYLRFSIGPRNRKGLFPPWRKKRYRVRDRRLGSPRHAPETMLETGPETMAPLLPLPSAAGRIPTVRRGHRPNARRVMQPPAPPAPARTHRRAVLFAGTAQAAAAVLRQNPVSCNINGLVLEGSDNRPLSEAIGARPGKWRHRSPVGHQGGARPASQYIAGYR